MMDCTETDGQRDALRCEAEALRALAHAGASVRALAPLVVPFVRVERSAVAGDVFVVVGEDGEPLPGGGPTGHRTVGEAVAALRADPDCRGCFPGP